MNKSLLKVGDTITFTLCKGTYQRPIIKMADKTATVEFTADYPCSSSKTPVGVKRVKYESITDVLSCESEMVVDATTQTAEERVA